MLFFVGVRPNSIAKMDRQQWPDWPLWIRHCMREALFLKIRGIGSTVTRVVRLVRSHRAPRGGGAKIVNFTKINTIS